MGLITHTNIVVDDFSYGKNTPSIRYVYFLTHFHSDHWQGITPKWSFGKIYCSPITKKLLLNRFPQVPDVEELELDKTHTIYLNDSKTLSVEVNFFDANHCPGAVMILFRGYMGTILHTGDFRFHISMIEENELLYPKSLRTPNFAKCSIHVDELVLDNTYCDPIFKFPNRDKALSEIIKIIEKNRDKRIYLTIATLGKEEMMIYLAEYFKTQIVVDERRYSNIVAIDYRPELFTSDPTKGWILLSSVSREQEAQDLERGQGIVISATGWGNVETYASGDGKKYVVPYSLHSNFVEMETFMRSVHPAILKAVVRNTNTSTKVNNIHQHGSYMVALTHLKQRGLEMFQKHYTNPKSLSQEYLECMKPEKTEFLKHELKMIPTEEDRIHAEARAKKYGNRFKKQQENKDLKRTKTVGDTPSVGKEFAKPVKPGTPVFGKSTSFPDDKSKSPLRSSISRSTTQVSTPYKQRDQDLLDDEEDLENEMEDTTTQNVSYTRENSRLNHSLTWNPDFESSNTIDNYQKVVPRQEAPTPLLDEIYNETIKELSQEIREEDHKEKESEAGKRVKVASFKKELKINSQPKEEEKSDAEKAEENNAEIDPDEFADLYRELYGDDEEEKEAPALALKEEVKVNKEVIAKYEETVSVYSEVQEVTQAQIFEEKPMSQKENSQKGEEDANSISHILKGFKFQKKEQRASSGQSQPVEKKNLKRKYEEPVAQTQEAQNKGSQATSSFEYDKKKMKLSGGGGKKPGQGQCSLGQWFSQR